MNTLKIINLKKTYRSRAVLKKDSPVVHALKGVSFELTPGFYGLLGPNGAGKSTLMNIIVGALSQDEGLVLWNERETKTLGIEFRNILGYMPQQQTLYENYTGRRFLMYIAALKGINENVPEEVERCARTVNLSSQLEKKLSAYSGGMKQRLLAAASVMGHPQILIMDEPMAGLDPKERVHLRNVLKEISKDAIVLVATHVVPDIETVADKILILKEGELHDIGTPQELIERYKSDTGMEGVYLRIFGEDDADETC